LPLDALSISKVAYFSKAAGAFLKIRRFDLENHGPVPWFSFCGSLGEYESRQSR